MSKCSSCGVIVHAVHPRCPLCQRHLSTQEVASENIWYPLYENDAIQRSRHFVSRLTDFITITVTSVSMVINLLTTPHTLWSLYVISSVLYVWLLIRHTMLSQAHLGAKIIGQVFGLSGMLVMVNMVEGSQRWSLNYVFPFIVILATLLITIIVLIKKMRWKEYVGFTLAVILLGYLPLLLYLLGISQVLWAAAISALYAFLTLVGMILFSDKSLKNEIIRRFHL